MQVIMMFTEINMILEGTPPRIACGLCGNVLWYIFVDFT